jgi:hypothetical protein
MTTLHQAMAELSTSENPKLSSDVIFATSFTDVVSILEVFADVSKDKLSTVAMMLSLFVTALRKYPDLTV